MPAHRYLAYLAREGIISEIISTNYDSCIEEAFLSSFWDRSEGEKQIYVISGLDGYRSKAGKRYTRGISGDPILHLYKINGCAKKYLENKSDFDRIILTEKQLQSFREEKWAEDLFKDRFRRRTFLFCGFGSEEPQIRHTALKLAKEFQKNDMPEDTVPFLTAHSTPEFAQLQILINFVSSSKNEFLKKNMDEIFKSLFQGNDASFMGSAEKSLSADLFFKRLYQVAFGKLLINYTKSGFPFFTWIQALSNHPASWVNLLNNTLYPDLDKEKSDDELLKNGYFGSFESILDLSGQRLLPLSQWVWAMKYPGKTISENTAWYPPLRENNLLILSFLMFVVILGHERLSPKSCPFYKLTPTKTDGAKLSINTDDGQKNFDIFFLHQGAVISTNSEERRRIVYTVLFSSCTRQEPERRLVSKHDEEYFVGRKIFVTAAELIRRAGKPEKLAGVLKNSFSRQKAFTSSVVLEPLNRLEEYRD